VRVCCCSVLQCVAVDKFVVEPTGMCVCGALYCIVLQYAAVCCSTGDKFVDELLARACVLQYVAVCSSVFQCVAVYIVVDMFVNEPTGTYVCVAVCCSVLYCCSVLRLTISWIVQLVRANVLQCVAVCRSVSQCVAVCCSVLQYIAVDKFVDEPTGTCVRDLCMYGSIDVWMCVSVYACMHSCMYVCMYGFMCMNICMYVCIYGFTHVCMYVCMDLCV